MLRSFFVALPFLVAGIAHAQGADCVSADFDNTCAGAEISFCPTEGDNPNTVNTIDCTFPDETTGDPGAPNGTCGTPGCVDVEGDGGACAQFDDTCLAGAGDACSGTGFLLDADEANNANAFSRSCVDGQACVTAIDAEGGIAETCEVQAFVCDAPFTVGCLDATTLVLCLGVSEDANGNNALDAGEDTDADGVIDVGVTTSPFTIACSGFFGACSDEAPDGPLHQAGLLAAGTPGPDCLLDAAEGEGEGEGEGEEGEGEDEDECSQDSDCGDGETCENGSCVAPPPACSNMTTEQAVPFAALGLLTVLIPAVGRRRRRG